MDFFPKIKFKNYYKVNILNFIFNKINFTLIFIKNESPLKKIWIVQIYPQFDN